MFSPSKYALAIVLGVWITTSLAAEEAGPYHAFSLRHAEREVRDSSKPSKAAFELGGITSPMAVVYDEARDDLILVGRAAANEQTITLDDLAVALRAILKHGEVPLVSIDWAPHTEQTSQQVVRFEGGIEDTAFGETLLNADVILKRVGLGILQADIWGVHSYFDMSAEEWKSTGVERPVVSRFWFMPDKARSRVAARDGVAVINEARLKVTTEVMGRARDRQSGIGEPRDEIGERFAAMFSGSWDDIAGEHAPVGMLDPLFRLTGLAEGIRKWMEEHQAKVPAVDYWINEYKVAIGKTPRHFSLEENTAVIQEAEKPRTLRISGGIDLEAMVLNLRDSSAVAFKQFVIHSRPMNDPLAWEIPLELVWNMDADEPAEEIAEKLARKPALRQARETGMSLRRTFHSKDGTEISPRLSLIDGYGSSRAPERQAFTSAEQLSVAPYSHNIGGVMLAGTAEVEGADRAEVNLTSGAFSLVVDGKDARIDPQLFRKFVTALWCVYYSDQDPGISIDPISPEIDRHLVRYIGRVINTDLGRVMRDADYRMKKWAVGTERPDVAGFRDVDAWAHSQGRATLASRRFWFVPENLRFKRAGELLLFDSGRMRVRTEFVADGLRGRAAPSDEAFAGFFTEHYDEIAEKHPAYKELFEYAKLVALAKYLKEQGVPLYWFLMAHKDLVLTEDSPGTVAQLAKGSEYFQGLTIQGGVKLGAESQYVLDAEAVAALNEALADQPSTGPERTASTRRDRRMPLVQPISFEAGRRSYTVLPQHTSSSGKDQRGIRYQTDVALRHGNRPGLELVRYFNGKTDDYGEFGKGWHLLIPYRVEPADTARRDFLGAVIPERMVVENRITGQREELSFSADRYAAAGYVPERVGASQLIGLFLMSNRSFRLADKLGNQFHFDPAGRLTDAFLSPRPDHHLHVEYVDGFTGALAPLPYAARPADGEKVSVRHLSIPKRVKVTDLVHGDSEVLCFAEDLDVVGYLPDDEETSRFRQLALLSGGGLELRDKHGNLIRFDSGWDFQAVLPSPSRPMVGAMTMAGQRARFSYTIDREGRVVIATAAVSRDLPDAEPAHVVRYEYDDQSRLARVRRPQPAVAISSPARTPPPRRLSYSLGRPAMDPAR